MSNIFTQIHSWAKSKIADALVFDYGLDGAKYHVRTGNISYSRPLEWRKPLQWFWSDNFYLITNVRMVTIMGVTLLLDYDVD